MTDLWTTEPQLNGPNQIVEIKPSFGEQHAEPSEEINIRSDMLSHLRHGS